MKTNIIQELSELKTYSEKCEKNQIEFWSNKQIINKNTGEIKDVDYVLKKEYKLKHNELISKSIYFEK